MHQQVRVFIRTTSGGDTSEGQDGGRLAAILDALKSLNLRSASRVRLDTGEEQFVFSVEHVGTDDEPDQKALAILEDRYEVEIIRPEHFFLAHRKGALLEKIRMLEEKEPVVEVHIGATGPDRKIPVQLVTRSMLNR